MSGCRLVVRVQFRYTWQTFVKIHSPTYQVKMNRYQITPMIQNTFHSRPNSITCSAISVIFPWVPLVLWRSYWGARFKKGVWPVNVRAIAFWSLKKIYICQYMCKIFCATSQREHLKFHKKRVIHILNNNLLSCNTVILRAHPQCNTHELIVHFKQLPSDIHIYLGLLGQ